MNFVNIKELIASAHNGLLVCGAGFFFKKKNKK